MFGVSLLTEPGFRVNVAQRLVRISGENDGTGLDEAYIEDEGLWRVGKQYLPFGSGTMLRESVFALRGDTDLLLDGWPISVAYADGGSGRPRGVVGRVGGRLGFSFAAGRNFGASATSFWQVRRPEESPGTGRGYRLALGVDFNRPVGSVRFFGEAIALRDGETPQDINRYVLEGGLELPLTRRSSLALAATRDTEGGSFLRVTAAFPVERRAQLEPFLRFDRSGLRDLALTIRIRF